MKLRPRASKGDTQLCCSLQANSENKTHHGLGVSRSEERGVECKLDWNTEAGCLPCDEEMKATNRLAGALTDKLILPGLLRGAEATNHLSQWFRFANNSERNTNVRLKLRV